MIPAMYLGIIIIVVKAVLGIESENITLHCASTEEKSATFLYIIHVYGGTSRTSSIIYMYLLYALLLIYDSAAPTAAVS